MTELGATSRSLQLYEMQIFAKKLNSVALEAYASLTFALWKTVPFFENDYFIHHPAAGQD